MTHQEKTIDSLVFSGLTPLVLKRLNRSLKSELTNIVALHSPSVLDQLPGGIKTRLRRQRLPILVIK